MRAHDTKTAHTSEPDTCLPPGVRLGPDGLEYDTDQLRDAYERATKSGHTLTVSEYLLEWWYKPFKQTRFDILTRLQRKARKSAPGRRRVSMVLTCAQVAEIAGLSTSTIRNFVSWLNRPHSKVLPGERLAWRAMRDYLQVVPDPTYHGAGKPPYQWTVLLDDILHPTHRDRLDDFTTEYSGGQRSMLFPGEGPVNLDGLEVQMPNLQPIKVQNLNLDGLEVQKANEPTVHARHARPDQPTLNLDDLEVWNLNLHPIKVEKETEAADQARTSKSSRFDAAPPVPPSPPAPPLPPYPPAATAQQQQTPSQVADSESDPNEAAAALSALGAGEDVIRELLGFTAGAFYTLLWLREIFPRKRRWKLPVGHTQAYDRIAVTRAAVRACCLPDRGSSWFTEAQSFLSAKREQAAAAEKRAYQASPPAGPAGSRERFIAGAKRESTQFYALLTRRGSTLSEADGEVVFTPAPADRAKADRCRPDFERIAQRLGLSFRIEPGPQEVQHG